MGPVESQIQETDKRWSKGLQAWGIPEEILNRAEQSPWSFDPEQFRFQPDQPLSPSALQLRKILGSIKTEHSSVLDVGAGAGNAFMGAIDLVRTVFAVERSPDMAKVLRRELSEENLDVYEVIEQDWMEEGARRPKATVVTSSHMVYNVAQLSHFVESLLSCAESAVVIEMTARHPHYPLNWLWDRFWGIKRCGEPSAFDVVEMAQLVSGLTPKVEVFYRPERGGSQRQSVESVRRRLCLKPERDEELEELISQGALLANPAVCITIFKDDSTASALQA